jgi:hypothetical protein
MLLRVLQGNRSFIVGIAAVYSTALKLHESLKIAQICPSRPVPQALYGVQGPSSRTGAPDYLQYTTAVVVGRRIVSMCQVYDVCRLDIVALAVLNALLTSSYL